MKKFITFSLCLLLCVVTLGLSGCGKSKKEIIDTSIATNGNGGTVVTRGDYVYFVNGYNSCSIFTKSNLDRKFDIGGLYRAKLNSNGELDYSENGSLVNAEKISSHLVGFESTSIYVFGNHIYYATPITNVDKNGNLQTNQLEFRRVSITGGSTDKLYQSKVDAERVDFEFYYADNNVYLVVNEDGTLKRVSCTGKVSVSEVTTGITSIALARDSYDVFESDSYKNIFYTKTNDDGKIEIYNYNALTNKEEYKKTTNYKTCELVDYKFGHLYYKASGEDFPNYTYFYRVDATKNAVTNLVAEKLTSDKDYTDIYLLDNETDGYIVKTDSKTYYLSYNSGTVSDPVVISTAGEIIAVKNNYIYYNDSDTIKRVSIYDLRTTGSVVEEEIITVKDMQAYSYDIDDNNLYVYAKSGENTYLYSIKVSNIMEGESYEQKLLGVYLEGDEPEEN